MTTSDLIKVSTKQFSYDKNTATFATEVSDLGKGFNFRPFKENKLLCGLALESERTNAVLAFYLVKEFRDREYEITHWSLISECGNFKMVIFND